MASDLEDLRDFLPRTPFFGGLDERQLDRVIAMLVERHFTPRSTVFREGESGRSMYIIHDGSLVVCRGGESGHLVKLVRLGPGDFFGEMTLIEVQPRANTVVVETPAKLWELTNMDLYRLYQEDIEAYVMVLQNINRELCRRLRKADGRIVEIADELGDEETQIRPAVPPRPR
jgi:CRP/FNR family transcriptional regulator, cyclic AMP receptor protein